MLYRTKTRSSARNVKPCILPFAELQVRGYYREVIINFYAINLCKFLKNLMGLLVNFLIMHYMHCSIL